MEHKPDIITAEVAAGSIAQEAAQMVGDLCLSRGCGTGVYQDGAREHIASIKAKLAIIEQVLAPLPRVKKEAA